jgi:hypothetical protein
MPVYVDVHKMAAVEVQRCWNVLDGTAGIMLWARSPPTCARTAMADETGRAVSGLAIFARSFTAG